MIEMTINGVNGVFLTQDEYTEHKKDMPIRRSQVWERKMPAGSSPGPYIYIIAVDEVAQVAVGKIIKGPDDPAPMYHGSGIDVGYSRTFKDIRSKYDYVGSLDDE